MLRARFKKSIRTTVRKTSLHSGELNDPMGVNNKCTTSMTRATSRGGCFNCFTSSISLLVMSASGWSSASSPPARRTAAKTCGSSSMLFHPLRRRDIAASTLPPNINSGDITRKPKKRTTSSFYLSICLSIFLSHLPMCAWPCRNLARELPEQPWQPRKFWLKVLVVTVVTVVTCDHCESDETSQVAISAYLRLDGSMAPKVTTLQKSDVFTSFLLFAEDWWARTKPFQVH